MPSSNNRYIFKKLNNYDYSTEGINNIINYINNKIIPSELTTNYKKSLFEKRFKDFIIKDSKLYYKPLDLEVITDDQKQTKLKELYDDMKIGPGSSMRNFYYKITQKYLNIKRDDVENFIKNQPAYQITTHQKQKMVQHPLLSVFPNQNWSTDLIDMTLYEDKNRHFKYILTAIDNFSRYTFAVALKNRDAQTIIDAFEKIRNEQSQNILPILLLSDNGCEFKNDLMKEYCDQNEVKQLFTPSHTPTANSLCENFNRYLQK